jgi:hypothetical protein
MSHPDSNRLPHLLIFRDADPKIYAQMTPAVRAELVRQWTAWVDGLMAQGKMLSGHPLELGGSVISGKNGERTTDGPYAEAKEAVAGYFFLTVKDFAEAQAIARQCPSLPHGISVEVRAIAAFSPVLPDLSGRPSTGEK